MNDLVTENMNLVHYVVARQFKIPHYHQDYDDLVQTSMVGLIKAAEKFDASLGYQFATYAVPKIYGEVQRYRRDNRPVKVPRTWSEVAYTLRRQGLDHLAADEIAATLGCQDHVAAGAIKTNQLQVISTNKPITLSDNEKVEFENLLGEDDDLSQSLVDDFMASLDVREQTIIIYKLEGQSQTIIADRLSITQAQVSRLLKKIAGKYQQWSVA